MGNMLMATPAMEMLHRGGWQVDLCLQGETPGVETLFEGWPHARTVSPDPAPFVEREYGVYLYGFGVSGPPIGFANRDQAVLLHPFWDWFKGFQLHSEIELYTNLARLLAPEQPLVTRTSCTHSERHFDDIGEKTCVLVPGGGAQTIIRKWPFYPQLAERFDDVAVVGLPSDLEMGNRIYFRGSVKRLLGDRVRKNGLKWRLARSLAAHRYHDQDLVFPDHVKNYIGRLSLADTAALIARAGCVIGNDCGVTHLAVALGKPVFAILGPSSRRKIFPPFIDNVTVISRSLDCQPCQEKPGMRVWRSDADQCHCPVGIRCLDEIGPGEVYGKVSKTMGARS
jgi:hypothetical protein